RLSEIQALSLDMTWRTHHDHEYGIFKSNKALGTAAERRDEAGSAHIQSDLQLLVQRLSWSDQDGAQNKPSGD
ncbi:hypothetical protein GOODEAATRI_019119, partial [Goodea atripinnis]